MQIPRNPHLNRAMIRSTRAFFGRRRELARVGQRLGSDPPQSVALTGDRRIGKSSLLWYLSRPEVKAQYLEDPERALFLFLDFQEEPRPTVETFVTALFRRLEEQRPEGPRLEGEPSCGAVQAAVARLDREGCRLILLLDEFDRVIRSSRFGADFYAFLRSLAGHHNVAYVTASSRDLQKLCSTQEIADSPFFNIFTTVQLGPLTHEEALELVCEPTRGGPVPLAPHQQLILELGGHWPFFLQIACSAAFEVLVETGAAEAARVRERFLEDARPHFQFYWEQLDAVSRAVCNRLAGGGRPEAGEALDDLRRRGFALEDGRLFSAAFAEFARAAYAREVGEVPVEVQAERARGLAEELETARQMQMDLLPQAEPEVPGLQIRGRLAPASTVAGDFFTYLWLDEAHERLAIVAADVMGHGMEAAVTAMRFSETLRYEARGRQQPTEIMEGLNRSLTASLSRGYVGCCIAVIEPATRQVTVSCGGYRAPLRCARQEGRVEEPQLGNLPLGISAAATYAPASLRLEAGDLMLIYSDGVVEARGDRDDEYGQARLEELLLEAMAEGLDAEQVLARLLWDVERFSASVGQTDDITAIVVRAL